MKNEFNSFLASPPRPVLRHNPAGRFLCAAKGLAMKYQQAKKCFGDVRNHITPRDEPVLWNLTNGLVHLTDAVRSDLSEIRQRLDALEKQQKRP